MFANIEMGNTTTAAPEHNPHKMTRDELIAEVIRLRLGIEDMIKINNDGLTALNGESHAVLAMQLVEALEALKGLLEAWDRWAPPNVVSVSSGLEITAVHRARLVLK